MADSSPDPVGAPGRPPGRPRQREGAADVRERLLDAATQLFTHRGHENVALREIAAAAGVTPAMVSYYFGDKHGLVEAVFQRTFDDLLAAVGDLMSAPANEPLLSRLARTQISSVAASPWMPRFVLREVLSPDSPLRERFVERFARRAAEIVPSLIEREIAAGRLRRDLDPTLVVLSMIGMAVFPFLAHPALGGPLGYQLDADFTERLIEHTTRLLHSGCDAPEEVS